MTRGKQYHSFMNMQGMQGMSNHNSNNVPDGQLADWYTLSMLRATPFLLFDGNCAEAMTFYRECVGGELTLTKLGDSPMKDMLPKEKHERIINAHLASGDFEISATDWMASPEFDPVLGNMSAIFVTGSTAEVSAIFAKLKAGGGAMRVQEMHEMPFGTYGQLYDRYGVQWIFRGNPDQTVS